MRMIKSEYSGADLEMAHEIIKECATVTDIDRCEAAYKIKQCGELAAKDRGISLEDF